MSNLRQTTTTCSASAWPAPSPRLRVCVCVDKPLVITMLVLFIFTHIHTSLFAFPNRRLPHKKCELCAGSCNNKIGRPTAFPGWFAHAGIHTHTYAHTPAATFAVYTRDNSIVSLSCWVTSDRHDDPRFLRRVCLASTVGDRKRPRDMRMMGKSVSESTTTTTTTTIKSSLPSSAPPSPPFTLVSKLALRCAAIVYILRVR